MNNKLKINSSYINGMDLLKILNNNPQINQVDFDRDIKTDLFVAKVVGNCVYSYPAEYVYGSLEEITLNDKLEAYKEIDESKRADKILFNNPNNTIEIWVEWNNGPFYGLYFNCKTYICTSAAIVGNVKCETFKIKPVHMRAFCKRYYQMLFNRLNIECDTINIPKSAISKSFLKEVETIKTKDDFCRIFDSNPKFNHFFLSNTKIF